VPLAVAIYAYLVHDEPAELEWAAQVAALSVEADRRRGRRRRRCRFSRTTARSGSTTRQ
jgi:hypothetical protein